ncbi:MAG: hypothetical protein HY231_01140 [Acidobacteria bacterium]|nr:hypothetical protein [Acidobacteriota bacterium]
MINNNNGAINRASKQAQKAADFIVTQPAGAGGALVGKFARTTAPAGKRIF